VGETKQVALTGEVLEVGEGRRGPEVVLIEALGRRRTYRLSVDGARLLASHLYRRVRIEAQLGGRGGRELDVQRVVPLADAEADCG